MNLLEARSAEGSGGIFFFFFNLAVKLLSVFNKCRFLKLQPEMDASVWATGQTVNALSRWVPAEKHPVARNAPPPTPVSPASEAAFLSLPPPSGNREEEPFLLSRPYSGSLFQGGLDTALQNHHIPLWSSPCPPPPETAWVCSLVAPPAWLQEAGNGCSVSQTRRSPECPPTHQESLPNHPPLLQTPAERGGTGDPD